MRALLVGDIHLSDRPPSARRETYAAEVIAKLEQTVDIANTGGADVVIWAGDVFHIKTPSRTSHFIVQRTIQLLREYEMPVYIVIGNHDLRHDDLDTLDSQPLGTVFASGAAAPLTGEVEVPPRPGVRGMPHVLFGIPYLKNWDRDLHRYMTEWGRSRAALMVTHAPIVPPGVSLPYETIDAARWAEKMGRPGSVYYGHMHHCDGAYVAASSEKGDFHFCNQGALSRGSLHEGTLKREPAVTWFDTDCLEKSPERWDGPWLRVPIEHLPPEEAFDLRRVEEETSSEERLDAFLEALDSTTLRRVSAEEIAADMAERDDLDPMTIEAVRECLEASMAE